MYNSVFSSLTEGVHSTQVGLQDGSCPLNIPLTSRGCVPQKKHTAGHACHFLKLESYVFLNVLVRDPEGVDIAE